MVFGQRNVNALFHKQSGYDAVCAHTVLRVNSMFPCLMLLNTCTRCILCMISLAGLDFVLDTVSAFCHRSTAQYDVFKTCHHRQTVLCTYIHILLIIMDLWISSIFHCRSHGNSVLSLVSLFYKEIQGTIMYVSLSIHPCTRVCLSTSNFYEYVGIVIHKYCICNLNIPLITNCMCGNYAQGWITIVYNY
jgi:hypothetical protein